MTPLLIPVLKAGLICGFVSLVAWIAVYTKLAKWWRNPVGRTLVTKTALIAALFVPSILSLFFHLTRSDSILVGWIDAALIWLVTPVMLWRCFVWLRLHKAGKLHPDREGDGQDAARPRLRGAADAAVCRPAGLAAGGVEAAALPPRPR